MYSNDEATEQAIIRVRDIASIRAPDEVILSFIHFVGPDTILQATIQDIRDVAAAF